MTGIVGPHRCEYLYNQAYILLDGALFGGVSLGRE